MLSTCVFDLETSALEGDKGVILCACSKSSEVKGVKIIRTDLTSKGWARGFRGDDQETCKQVVAELVKHDIIVAHNGSRFDVPFLRTRLLHWGMPRLPDIKLVDPCSIAYRKLRLRSNSLGVILDHLGVKERKTPLDMSVWADAVQNGSKPAMDLIVEHCIMDVKVLDAVLNAMKPYIKVLDDRGSSL